MDADAEKVLLFLERKHAGFNELMTELKISNHPLRRALGELEKEGMIRKLTKQEQSRTIQRPRGHPTEPYTLTQKGAYYAKQLRRREEFGKLKERFWQEFERGSISFGELCANIEAERQRLSPSKEKTRQEILEALSECVEALQPNTLMLIETEDEKNPNITMTVLSKEDFKLNTFKVKKGKGVAPSYSIEPVAGLKMVEFMAHHEDVGSHVATVGVPLGKAAGGPRQSKRLQRLIRRL